MTRFLLGVLLAACTTWVVSIGLGSDWLQTTSAVVGLASLLAAAIWGVLLMLVPR